MTGLHPLGICLAVLVAASGCSQDSRSSTRGWTGSVDTLPSGQVVVTNTAEPLWPTGGGWEVVEELRVGTADEVGPELFGQIASFEVDRQGRIYVLESQLQELRVFDADGSHIRTIGRRGGGPGEFAQAVMVKLAPDGRLWVVDPQNNRISFFDSAGTLLGSRPTPGGFIIIPWPGGFDDAGNYYTPIWVTSEGGATSRFRRALERYDADFQLRDTIQPPRPPDRGDWSFVVRSEGGSLRAGIPFTPAFNWRLHRSGTLWALDAADYHLFRLDPSGDTLRSITRGFEPYPVTEADIEAAIAQLDWFVAQGGEVERDRIPSTKPPALTFFFDDRDNIYVVRVTTLEDEWRLLDVFDAEGRYLGEIRLPFRIRRPYPIVRGSTMWAVTTDELDVPYIVRARIVRPTDGQSES